MASVSRLGRQIEEAIATLNAMDARFALIGGLALASHKVIRATLRANRASLKMDEVREYFRLFEREPLLEELLNAGD
jgi:hypothetical protein